MKKRGFTLIELLTVIIILAIIALIAVPIILGIVNEAKYKAFRESLNNTFHAYEIYEVDNKLKDNSKLEKEIDISKLPINSNLKGTITRNENGELELKDITDGTYCASGTKNNLNIIKGTCDDLYKNILEIKVSANFNSRDAIITVDTIKGIPTSFSYKIIGPDNKTKEKITSSSTYTFTKLKPGTSYTIIVAAINKAGLKNEKTVTGETTLIDKIKLELNLENEEDKDKEYIKSAKIKITYPFIEEGLVNKYKWDDDEDFTPVSGNSIEVTAKNGTLIAVILDGEEVVTSNQITVNNVDNVDPEVTLSTVQKTTNSITIPFSVVEEHIDTITCKYSDTIDTYTINGAVGESACTLSNELKNNETYYYEICVSDLAGNETCKAGSTNTEEITNPGVNITHTPSNASSSTSNGYSKEEVAEITFTNIHITTPTYYIKSTSSGVTNNNVIATCTEENDLPKACSSSSTTNIEADTWYKVSGDINITYSAATETPITVYAVTYDGKNYSGASTGTTIKIEKTGPELTLGTITKTTNSMVINYTLSDTKSGVDTNTITCKLGMSKGTYNINGTATLTSCTATGLKDKQNYYYKICVSDKAGNNKCYETDTSESTEEITNPGVNITHTPSNAGASTTNGYSKEEVAHVTFTSTNITTPAYYIKSTSSGVTNNNVIATCTEENDLPKACSSSSTTNIEANTWYKVSGNINITYNTETETPITVYAVTYDGENFSTASTGTTIKIDRSKPEITNIAVSGTLISSVTATITATDPAGLHATAYSCDGIWQTSNVCTFSGVGEHTIKVKDKVGNESDSKSVTFIENAPSDTKGLFNVIYYNPVSGNLCNKTDAVSTTGTKTGCMKWYAYDQEFGYYIAILDHNTTAEVSYLLQTEIIPAVMQTELDNLTKSVANGGSGWKVTPRLITGQEVADKTGHTAWYLNSDQNFYYFDASPTNSTKRVANLTNKSKYYWLYDYTEACISRGCNDEDSSTRGYWTSSRQESGGKWWVVEREGYLYRAQGNYTGYGLRPVIEIPKPACFVAGTQILTENGFKNIEDVRIGDRVYSMQVVNGKNIKSGIKRVTNTIVNKSDITYRVTIGNEEIEVTGIHPIYVVGRGWVPVEKLKINDKVLTFDRNYKIVSNIEIKYYKEPINVYNFKVEDYHTYLVTKQGLLVHNKDIGLDPTW